MNTKQRKSMMATGIAAAAALTIGLAGCDTDRDPQPPDQPQAPGPADVPAMTDPEQPDDPWDIPGSGEMPDPRDGQPY